MRKLSVGRAGIGFAALAFAFVVQAKDEDKKNNKPEEFKYNVAVEQVEVDVLAQDGDGNFVSGLTKADFEVFEEGKKVEISDFEERQLAAPLAPLPQKGEQPKPPPPNAPVGRRFIMFVDLLNLGFGALQNAKPYLLKFINSTLTPTDEVMISILAPDQRLLVLQPFTNDRVRLAQVVEKLRGNANMDTQERSVEDDVYRVLYGATSARVGGLNGGESMGLAQMEVGIQNAASLVENFSVQEYNRGAIALDSLASLVERIDQVGWEPGRKTVIYVSEGLPLRPGQTMIDVINQRIEEYNRLLEVNPDPTQASGSRAFPVKTKQDLQSLLTTTVGRLNRYSATLYTIDARGSFQLANSDPGRPKSNLSPGQQNAGFIEAQQTLNSLAIDTGGIPFFNQSDLTGVMNKIDQDNRSRYFLTYSPPQHKKGKRAKYYSIEVKCKRPGVKIRARNGYLD